MKFERVIVRQMPDGIIRRLRPFHISFEGLETNIICRDDEDCDIMVKQICLCGRRMNIVIVTYGVVGNHAHIIVLAESYEDALNYAYELKRVYSQYFHLKYQSGKALARTEVDVREIDSDWYLRNAIAYDIANALDTGVRIEEYRWTSYRAMFPTGAHNACRRVKDLPVRTARSIFRTNADLRNSKWLIDLNDELIPSSICYHKYAEAAFNNDLSFFMKALGSVNKAEMQLKLSGKKLRDNDILPIVNEVSNRWFSKNVDDLALTQKVRLIPYVFRTNRTSVNQLARVFHLQREEIAKIVGPSF